MNKNKLIYNAIQTPDGTILESRHRHDYKTYTDANGEEYMIDGGIDYIRSNINKTPAKSLALYNNDDHKLIRTRFTWGTYGKNGNEPLRYITIEKMTDGHVNAIVDTQTHLPDFIMQLFIDELEYRK